MPPGAIVTTEAPGVTAAPEVADCASIETVHGPEPSPASVRDTSSALRAVPVASRKPYESEAGSAKSLGSFAAATLIRPPPSSKTDASCVRAVFPQAGPAVVIRADLTC